MIREMTVRVIVEKTNPTGLLLPSKPGGVVEASREAQFSFLGLWMEQLRYAGIGRVLRLLDEGTPRERMVIELNCPDAGKRTLSQQQAWAGMVSKRMCSFGFNAIAAPKWGGDGTGDLEWPKGGDNAPSQG